MRNLLKWVEGAAEGEPVEAVVIGEMGWGDYGKEHVPHYDPTVFGKVLPWAEAQPYLDYDFDSGYGAPGCQAIYAWTKSWVIFISQYDGSTRCNRIPRNPVDCIPNMPGG